MIYGYCNLICTHQSVEITRMNTGSNQVNNSNCFHNNKEDVKYVIDQKVLLLATLHSRDFIFSRDSLIELATEIAFVTRFMEISWSEKYLMVLNIDLSVRVISLCFEAKYDAHLRC